jgi:hypothetical protein
MILRERVNFQFNPLARFMLYPWFLGNTGTEGYFPSSY